jgi:hypothetical protein
MASFDVKWKRCGEKEKAVAGMKQNLQLTVSTLARQNVPTPPNTCSADNPDDPQCLKEAEAEARVAVVDAADAARAEDKRGASRSGGDDHHTRAKRALSRDIMQTVLKTSPAVQVYLEIRAEKEQAEQEQTREEEVRDWLVQLPTHERKDAAQNGEDGILESIFGFIGATNKVCWCASGSPSWPLVPPPPPTNHQQP